MTEKFVQSAEVFMKYINEKTKKKYIKYPFIETFYIKSERFEGIRFYSDKDDSSIQINNSMKTPGLIHSIPVWNKSVKDDQPDYEISSPQIPLTSLLADISEIVSSPKALQNAMSLQ